MTDWDRACLALRLLAIDPALGGAVIRARSGPARDAFLRFASQLPGQHIKLHPAMTADTLDGGIDLTATLQTGHLTEKQGLLRAKSAIFTLTMAERADPFLAARCAALLDAEGGSCILALDEGDGDEAAPIALTSRLAFHLNLDGLSLIDLQDPAPLAPVALGAVDTPDDLPEQLVMLAHSLGISSLRAPAFALRCARAHALLRGVNQIDEADVTMAVALCYAHLATRLPEPAEDLPDDSATQPDQEPHSTTVIPDDILLDAVKAALPKGLLEKLQKGGKSPMLGSGSGLKKTGNRRGRPLPARQSRGASPGRVDLMATLRAAIPYQTIRRKMRPDGPAAIILPADLRHKRYEDASDRVLIFAVDASGSAAMARLGEAKGAVELLLSEAYARRDHVALIAFRGDGAETLLPPTRSLVQTKRRLAALPGGGGTPLAAGLQEAATTATLARQKGLSPTIVLLTDGRSNIALDGTPDRAAAGRDAKKVARLIMAAGHAALVIDTGKRPDAQLRVMAQILNAPFIALPRADARGLSDAVQANLTA